MCCATPSCRRSRSSRRRPATCSAASSSIELLFNYHGIGQQIALSSRSRRTSPCSRRASMVIGSTYPHRHAPGRHPLLAAESAHPLRERRMSTADLSSTPLRPGICPSDLATPSRGGSAHRAPRTAAAPAPHDLPHRRRRDRLLGRLRDLRLPHHAVRPDYDQTATSSLPPVGGLLVRHRPTRARRALARDRRIAADILLVAPLATLLATRARHRARARHGLLPRHGRRDPSAASSTPSWRSR